MDAGKKRPIAADAHSRGLRGPAGMPSLRVRSPGDGDGAWRAGLPPRRAPGFGIRLGSKLKPQFPPLEIRKNISASSVDYKH